MTSPQTLPSARPKNPSCGACSAETSHDGEGFVCYPCGLQFANDDLTASYLDEDAEPCGLACTAPWHEDNGTSHFVCATCDLPSGHDSHCHTPCRIVMNDQTPAVVHWEGDAPTSLHGNGAASFEHTTRQSIDVTCRLCQSLLAREADQGDDPS